MNKIIAIFFFILNLHLSALAQNIPITDKLWTSSDHKHHFRFFQDQSIKVEYTNYLYQLESDTLVINNDPYDIYTFKIVKQTEDSLWLCALNKSAAARFGEGIIKFCDARLFTKQTSAFTKIYFYQFHGYHPTSFVLKVNKKGQVKFHGENIYVKKYHGKFKATLNEQQLKDLKVLCEGLPAIIMDQPNPAAPVFVSTMKEQQFYVKYSNGKELKNERYYTYGIQLYLTQLIETIELKK